MSEVDASWPRPTSGGVTRSSRLWPHAASPLPGSIGLAIISLEQAFLVQDNADLTQS